MQYKFEECQQMQPNLRCMFNKYVEHNEYYPQYCKLVLSFCIQLIFSFSPFFSRCNHDYLDIYAELQSDSDSLLDASLTGRFCGDLLTNLPRLVISSRNVLMLAFYTDDYKADKGFSVSYEFIDGSKYIFLIFQFLRVFI